VSPLGQWAVVVTLLLSMALIFASTVVRNFKFTERSLNVP
jgi:hypothetical protein